MGCCESFPSFVRWWKSLHDHLQQTIADRKAQRVNRAISEWDEYCHVLPQHAFTHDTTGKQIVRYVVKLEDLKSLRTSKPRNTVAHISPALKKALLDTALGLAR